MNISQIDGQITANSGSTDAGGKFSALGIEAREEITLGNISAAAAITAASGGMDAYGIYAGEESGNQTHSNITIGNVAGTIRAEAMAGTAAGASATGSLAVGDISGAISAASTGNAAAHGLLAEFSLTTGTINGTVSATTAGGTAAALMGVPASQQPSDPPVWLKPRQRETAERPMPCTAAPIRTPTFLRKTPRQHHRPRRRLHHRHLGTGRFRQGKLRGYHHAALRHGKRSRLFDYTVRTTVNTNKSDTATHHSSVTLNAGSADNKANWTISTEKAAGLVNRFNVAYGSNVTLTGDSHISP